MNIVGAHTLTQQAYALADVISGKEPPILYWLLRDPKEAAAAAAIISEFLPAGQEARAIHFDDEHVCAQLQQLLTDQAGVWTISISDFARLGPALSFVASNHFRCRAGQVLNPAQVKRTLAGLGYAEGEGAFHVRGKGAVLFVATPRAEYRLVFGEDGIEQIFDEGRQAQLAAISCPPAVLDLTQVPEKEVPLPRGDMAVDAVDRAVWRRAISETQQSWIQFMFASAGDVEDRAGAGKLFQLQPAPRFDKDFEMLREMAAGWQQESYVVHAYAIDPDVLVSAFGQAAMDAAGFTVHQQAVPMQGFIDKERRFVLLSHAEIFGRRGAAKKVERRNDAAFVTSLREHDYVVHEDHGVGRYVGLAKTMIEGHERENILIEYAKGDKLYVPIELAYKVDKYVGDAKPALQRLSGTSWLRLTRKAAHNSQEFAKELLAIYARRSLVRVDPWHIFAKADKEMHDSFGYQETPDQERAIQHVYEALSRHEPMDMLVVGDVGFGKTEVAIRAAYQGVLNKKQVVVLCPTTLLAQQHFDTFTDRYKGQGVRVEMLSRFTGRVGDTSKRPSDIIKDIERGDVHVVIGTHRLLSKDVRFQDLGLIIIDEEQRFGVRHKERLKSLRSQAHVLTLSATPIPRTLYFSLSGLRDIATIQTPPQGRKPIETSIEPYREERVREVVAKEISRGGQVFYLYNHVQTIHAAKRKLVELLGKDVRVDIVHGQMPEDEMARVAQAFDHGKIDVLVCTTIVENGLDLPNVNTLVVEDATRFGLGQLYQIRGRIGRGKAKAFAYFMHPAEGVSGVAARRLQILQEAKALGSGFQLAMRDLEMRGMGQLIGKRQHGHIQHVGLGMYGRLLRQAVEELESGHVEPPRRATTISLPVDYGIPETLMPDPETRSRLYRQLSQAQNLDDMKHILAPWDNEMSKLPAHDRQMVKHLLEILEVRLLAQSVGLLALDYQEGRGIDGRQKHAYVFEFERVRSEHVDRLVKVVPDFRVVGNQIQIPADGVSHPVSFVKKALRAFQQV